ncbi:FAD-binding oxidoreductase [Nocardia sp. 2]|uniref:FAD-binding oxidoreductase n=1 Tax=Nocardia acididurans TaxID=2802282 RepID=A0ABS1M3A8_9NOCA|nr:FAD-binding oxidoreductase [Nocardia acididurans]MBL1075050.1 FAD-binding oxidoreductase [Nocardia acididurans]
MGIGKDLRRVVRGRAVGQGEEGFDHLRLAWNRAVDQKVSAVVEVADAGDVAAVVKYAAQAGLAVSTQATGHGASTAASGTILVKTRGLDGVRVDAPARRAVVGAGAPWAVVLEAAAEHGLAGPVGSSDVVGVAGYTLGGGVGWFSRSQGLAASAVRALEAVTADGEQVRVTATAEPELFWALRGGGGGDFAVVTALEFELFEANRLYGGRMLWPARQAGAVVDAFRKATEEAPESLSLWFAVVQFPPFPQLPDFLRGQSMVVVDVVSADGVTAPLRWFDEIPGRLLDTRRELDATQLGGICMEPTTPTPSRARGELLTDFSPAVSEALLAAAIPGGTPAPLAMMQVRHLGGALTRPGPDAGAAGGIAEPYLLSLLGPVLTREMGAVVEARQQAVLAAVRPHITGRKPYTYLDAGESSSAAFDSETLNRLREIKNHYDPKGTLRGSFPIEE